MAIATSTALLIGGLAAAAASVAGTVVGAQQSKKAEKAANAELDTQNQAQQRQESLFKEQQTKLEGDRAKELAGEAATSAKQRQKVKVASATGRRGTILTTPLGQVGTTPSASKSLIGQ